MSYLGISGLAALRRRIAGAAGRARGADRGIDRGTDRGRGLVVHVVLGGVLSTALAGCGAGVGGDGYFCGYDFFGNPVFCSLPSVPSTPAPVASTLTFQTQAALQNIGTQTFSYTLTGYDLYGDVFGLQYASTPGAATTFNGASALTAAIRASASENGVPIALTGSLLSTTATRYVDPATSQLLGSDGNAPGTWLTVTSQQGVPASATVGASQSAYTAKVYHDAARTTLDATVVDSFQLQADTATTALMCFTDNLTLTQQGQADGLSSASQSVCYRIDAPGHVLGMTVTLPLGGSIQTLQ